MGYFADYSDHPFDYTPPSNCPGPYAKIIFRMHFRVTAGVQYDRTGAVWIDGTMVYFGTTSEPAPNASPEWTIERDVTELAPIFAQPSVGQASVYNIVNSKYTGIILGWAELEFYPATQHYGPGRAADAVFPLAAGPTGGYVALNGPSNQMTGSFSFPKNTEAAYLDVFLESQGGDEFWYTCFPNDLAQKFSNCGNTAFREGDVFLDGKPAGVAPVYPRIYTGGIDPYLWIPIPGVQTLNFRPYRVDLTPFAGLLDDGNPHTVAVSVFNDNNYFNANAVLLVYEDHAASQVTGALLSDGTPAFPHENVIEHVTSTPSGGGHGKIIVTATHPVALHGYVITSKGRVDTTVRQKVDFSNVQHIDVTSSRFIQDITQLTTVSSQTDTRRGGRTTSTIAQSTWPLTLNYHYVASGGGAVQTTSVQQVQSENVLLRTPSHTRSSTLFDTVKSADTLTITPSGFTPSNGRSRQQVKELEFGGYCWEKTLESRNYVIVNSTKGC
ncbi:MAG: peptide-N(4)-(N-acetyl-beta-glucosaminyl)asparagine amidase [Candidatus Eremiobacteraeota bacterium]|nr:peptide-N(4)-(N-acetyl-beta-glucosaminyl)asparagine amidase [Candidatus Eremiobacteraeota bacterium]